MQVATDLLIVTTSDRAGTLEDLQIHRPAGQPPVQLGRNIEIVRLPYDEAESYLNACEPQGIDPPPARQFGQRYTFVRRDAPAPDNPTWDPDDSMLAAVALSRLIRPNPAGTEYALRRLDGENARHRHVVPPFETRFVAFVTDTAARDWLDNAEAEELRDLLARYWQDESALPERIRHAMWLSEYGSRLPYVDVAWPHVVTILEALLNTERRRIHKQFVTRTVALADELHVDGITRSFADAAYAKRSHAVHGAGRPDRTPPNADTQRRADVRWVNSATQSDRTLECGCRRDCGSLAGHPGAHRGCGLQRLR
jgi:hypothetical protein